MKIEDLLWYLALYKGKIVSTASLDTMDIKQAEASKRMFVGEDSLGYVWEPDINRIPVTEEEIKWFERWYPLEVPLPEKLKNPSYILDRTIDNILGVCQGAKCTIVDCKVCGNKMY